MPMGRWRVRALAVLVAAAVVAFAVPGAGEAAETYDVYEGEGIQEAIDDASPGDTIRIHEGEYEEDLTVDQELTIRSYSSDEVVLTGSI
ncbi:MAG: hypothetical protein R6U70_09075, partial [Bacillota bacterium]